LPTTSAPAEGGADGGGTGAGDASHVIKGGGQDLTRTTGQVKKGDIEADRKTINLQALKAEQRAEARRCRS
jgi:chemotaxis protein MotB